MTTKDATIETMKILDDNTELGIGIGSIVKYIQMQVGRYVSRIDFFYDNRIIVTSVEFSQEVLNDAEIEAMKDRLNCFIDSRWETISNAMSGPKAGISKERK